MMNVKYRNFDGWIPHTDIDSIDVDKKYLRDIVNGDIINGMVVNAIAPVKKDLPTSIKNLINSGWELLLVKYFYHSTQGDTYVYVLYKFDTEHLLKIFVNNVELILDEVSEDIHFLSKPVLISYSLVNDQLKINFNITAEFRYNGVFDTKSVLYNITILYTPYKAYKSNTIYLREAGWLAVPRWVGWLLDDEHTEVVADLADTDPFVGMTEYYIDFTDTYANYQASHDLLFVGDVAIDSVWKMCKIFINSSSNPQLHQIYLRGLYHAKSIEIRWMSNIPYTMSDVILTFQINMYINKKASSEPRDYKKIELYEESIDSTQFNVWKTIEIPINFYPGDNYDFSDLDDFNIEINVLSNKYDFNYNVLYIDWIRINPLEACVVCVHDDNQRGLIKSEFPLNIKSSREAFNDDKGKAVLKIPICKTDWRIKSYELYAKINGVYLLIGKADVDGSWTVSQDLLYFKRYFNYLSLDEVQTLNFNYGLGATVRVDNQKIINDEIFYRGRTYFVKDDDKIYYSHLSGTGLPQPDCFPYDEGKYFGYMITDYHKVNKALAKTLLDECVIFTEDNSYIYVIDGSSGGIYRKLKANNSSMGISSIKSLMVDLDGSPLTNIIAWVSNEAIYGYAGGYDAPVKLTGLTHKEYWNNINKKHKDNAIGFLNKSKNEYWLQIDDNILIYEIDTGSWKKYKLDFRIKDVVGYVDNKTLLLTDDNDLYELDPQNDEYLETTIETHNDICLYQDVKNYYGAGSQQKILSDVYLMIAEPELTESLLSDLTIISDDCEIETIKMPLNYYTFISKTALFNQFGFIRFRYKFQGLSSRIGIREIGFFYIPTALGNVRRVDSGIGQNVGGQTGIYL